MSEREGVRRWTIKTDSRYAIEAVQDPEGLWVRIEDHRLAVEELVEAIKQHQRQIRMWEGARPISAKQADEELYAALGRFNPPPTEEGTPDG